MTKRMVLAAAWAALALMAPAAFAHQTVTSNGAAVTLHVGPGDKPRAGSPALIRVLRVRVPRRAGFAFSRCGCRLKISDGARRVLIHRPMKTRTRFTFPRAGAYRLTYSGSYTRAGRRKRFSASFAVRVL